VNNKTLIERIRTFTHRQKYRQAVIARDASRNTSIATRTPTAYGDRRNLPFWEDFKILIP